MKVLLNIHFKKFISITIFVLLVLVINNIIGFAITKPLTPFTLKTQETVLFGNFGFGKGLFANQNNNQVILSNVDIPSSCTYTNPGGFLTVPSNETVCLTSDANFINLVISENAIVYVDDNVTLNAVTLINLGQIILFNGAKITPVQYACSDTSISLSIGEILVEGAPINEEITITSTLIPPSTFVPPASFSNGVTPVQNVDPLSGGFYFVSPPGPCKAKGYTPASALVDYGDAPDTAGGTGVGNYQTLSANNGPRHTITSGLHIGTAPDGDTDGFANGADANNNATDDDTEGTADEGSISFGTLIENDTSYSLSNIAVTNTTGGNATLFGWIDFDKNGSFDEDERATATVANGAATVSLTWSSLPGISVGTTYARFRIARSTDLTAGSDGDTDEASLGLADSGEIEDYQITIAASPLDFGDAPNSFNTNLASDGARHVVNSNLYLGVTAPDSEADAIGTTADADSDDGDNADDEDADIAFSRRTLPSFTTGASEYRIPLVQTVNSTGSDATIYAWVDFDGSGTFDSDEATTITVPDGTGLSGVEWTNIPSDIVSAGTQINIRLRITTDNLVDTGGTAVDERSFGLANDGEVEDFAITVRNVVNVACNANTLWTTRGNSAPINSSLASVDISTGTPTNHSDILQSVALAQASNGILFYPEFGSINRLIKFDGTNAAAVGVLPTNGLRLIRMGIGSDGIGYFTVGPTLYRFDSNAATVTFTDLGAITNAAGNAVDFTDPGGDLMVFGDGTIFIVNSNGHTFTVDPTTVEAVYRGQVTGSPTIGGAALGSDGTLYVGTLVGGNTGALYSATINPATTTWALTQIGAANTAHGDLASCFNPANPFAPKDYSDAPASYDDATHNVVSGIRLGANIDGDSGSLASTNADGDDNDGTPDDEDGVTIPALTRGASENITVNVTQASADSGYLQGWIDWNGDGDFLDTGEQIATDLQYSAGTTGNITVPVTVPLDATTNQTFARFRWSTTSGLDHDDAATDGEVEDYAFTISALPQFACTSAFLQSVAVPAGNDPATLYSITPSGTGQTVTPIGDDSHGISYNAIGFNKLDNLVYGVERTAAGDTLVVVDGNGVAYRAGTLSSAMGGQPGAGDTDDSGNLYVRVGGQNFLYRIDLATRNVTPIAADMTKFAVADFAWNPADQQLYGVGSNTGQVMRMNPVDGSITDIGTGDSSLTLFGAQFFDGNGDFYGIENSTGNIYRFDITDGTNVLVSKDGVVAQGNDGASCRSTAFLPEGTINGTLYHDANGSDTFNSGTETEIANITVSLYFDNGTPGNTSDDTLVATKTTDSNGFYEFTNVNAASGVSYRIEVDESDTDLPSGYTPGTPNPVESVTVTNGSTTMVDFGFDSQPIFACNNDFYMIDSAVSSGPVQFSKLALAPSVGLTSIGNTSHGFAYNAIGYRTQDNYIYGIADGGKLVRVGSNGSVLDLGVVTGLPTGLIDSGDVASDGFLYVKPDGNGSTMYRVDVTTTPATATAITLNQGININDLAFNPLDNKAYAIVGTQIAVITISGSSAAVTRFGTVNIPASGSHFFDNQGNFYAVRNNTGGVYIVDVGTNGNGSGTSTLIGTFGSRSRTDGAFCPSAPAVTLTDVSAYKSVKLTNDADGNGNPTPGDTVEYTIHYVNEGYGFIRSFQINDQLPPGLTITAAGAQTITTAGSATTAAKNAAYTGASAGALSNLLDTGARLGGRGTVTVTIPATIDSGATGTLSNQSSATSSDLSSAVSSDNAGQTSDLPSALQATPFSLTVPNSSVAQTIAASIDPTTLTLSGAPNIKLVKDCTVPTDCTTAAQEPETELTYKIDFTNDGTLAAQGLAIVDGIPENTDFKVGSATSNVGTTGLTFTIEYSSDFNPANPTAATWGYTPASGGGGADSGYDRNVKAIRWRVTAGTLSQTSPNNTGSVSFVTKIR